MSLYIQSIKIVNHYVNKMRCRINNAKNDMNVIIIHVMIISEAKCTNKNTEELRMSIMSENIHN